MSSFTSCLSSFITSKHAPPKALSQQKHNHNHTNTFKQAKNNHKELATNNMRNKMYWKADIYPRKQYLRLVHQMTSESNYRTITRVSRSKSPQWWMWRTEAQADERCGIDPHVHELVGSHMFVPLINPRRRPQQPACLTCQKPMTT